MTTLIDAVRIEVPQRSPVGPTFPLDPSWDNASETRSPKRPFEVESRSASPRTQWERLAMDRGRPLWREAA